MEWGKDGKEVAGVELALYRNGSPVSAVLSGSAVQGGWVGADNIDASFDLDACLIPATRRKPCLIPALPFRSVCTLADLH